MPGTPKTFSKLYLSLPCFLFKLGNNGYVSKKEVLTFQSSVLVEGLTPLHSWNIRYLRL